MCWTHLSVIGIYSVRLLYEYAMSFRLHILLTNEHLVVRTTLMVLVSLIPEAGVLQLASKAASFCCEQDDGVADRHIAYCSHRGIDYIISHRS